MASEWEELERLTKDELIIELVKARWEKRNLQNILGNLSKSGGYGMVYEPGTKPSKEWQEKISEYVFKDLEEGRYSDLTEWGVDEEIGDRLYDEYCAKHFDSDGRRLKNAEN